MVVRVQVVKSSKTLWLVLVEGLCESGDGDGDEDGKETTGRKWPAYSLSLEGQQVDACPVVVVLSVARQR